MSDFTDLFPGFASHWIDTQAGRIFARSKGDGPPLILLHGFPQTHAMWHRVAPVLARRFHVVAMDLRGYGWSSAPDSEAGAEYTKRRMGEDVIAVMGALGHVRFRVVGHDRGARVAYRLALDHPGHLESLALLDVLPTSEVWRTSAPAARRQRIGIFWQAPRRNRRRRSARTRMCISRGFSPGGQRSSRCAPSMPARSRNIEAPGATRRASMPCARTIAPA